MWPSRGPTASAAPFLGVRRVVYDAQLTSAPTGRTQQAILFRKNSENKYYNVTTIMVEKYPSLTQCAYSAGENVW